MRRTDCRDTENSFVPRLVGEQPAGVEPAHAVADQMHRLVAKCLDDLLPEPPGPALDAGDRLDPRHQDTVSRRFQGLRNATEIRRQCQRADTNPGESKQPGANNNRHFSRAKVG